MRFVVIRQSLHARSVDISQPRWAACAKHAETQRRVTCNVRLAKVCLRLQHSLEDKFNRYRLRFSRGQRLSISLSLSLSTDASVHTNSRRWITSCFLAFRFSLTSSATNCIPVCSCNTTFAKGLQNSERTHARTYAYVRPGSGSDVSIARCYVSRRLPPPAISTGGLSNNRRFSFVVLVAEQRSSDGRSLTGDVQILSRTWCVFHCGDKEASPLQKEAGVKAIDRARGLEDYKTG